MRINKDGQSPGRASLGLKNLLAEPLFWECVLSLLPLQILAFIGLLEWIRP